MRFADVNRCIYPNAVELCLTARSYSLNIAVYQVDPHSFQHYALIQEFDGDPMLPTAPLCPFFSLNSLTAIGGHDRQYFNELRSTIVSRRIFIRSQSLMAR